MPAGIGRRVSRAVSGAKTGMSSGARGFMKHPIRNTAIGGAAVMGIGAMRGRRGSGTGSRMPGSQKGIRNY